MSRLARLLAELKRRRVYHVGVVYAAAAFVAAQAADIFLPRLGLPDWTVTAVVVLAVAGFPVALLLGWAFDITPTGVQRTDVATDDAPPPGTWRVAGATAIATLVLVGGGWWLSSLALRPSPQITSLAVLPLQNLMGDPAEDYFVDGMHEALTAELSKITALRVISRTSTIRYRGTDKSMPEIARELRVVGLIEGSVLRHGDQVRITVQFIHGPTDRHLWAESYQRRLGDVLTLQREVARAVATEIQVTLTPDEERRLAAARPVDPEAYQLWLRGNFHRRTLTEESFWRALGFYEDAIAIDPGYAPAHAGIAWSYIDLASWFATVPPPEVLPLARQSVELALALDPDLATAQAALATIRFWFEWDWAEARHAFERTLALDPNAISGYGHFLAVMGRFGESIELYRRDLERNPLSPSTYFNLASTLSLTGNDDEALDLYRQGFDLAPHHFQGHLVINGFHYARRGELDMALSHLERAMAIQETARTLGWLGYLHASAGRQADAYAVLARLLERRGEAYTYEEAEALAWVHIGLGDHDEALRWLEVAYEEREMGLVWLKEHWVFDPLRDDPRFEDLLRRMNFPT